MFKVSCLVHVFVEDFFFHSLFFFYGEFRRINRSRACLPWNFEEIGEESSWIKPLGVSESSMKWTVESSS